MWPLHKAAPCRDSGIAPVSRLSGKYDRSGFVQAGVEFQALGQEWSPSSGLVDAYRPKMKAEMIGHQRSEHARVDDFLIASFVTGTKNETTFVFSQFHWGFHFSIATTDWNRNYCPVCRLRLSSMLYGAPAKN
jgi:hypothetical protein